MRILKVLKAETPIEEGNQLAFYWLMQNRQKYLDMERDFIWPSMQAKPDTQQIVICEEAKNVES